MKIPFSIQDALMQLNSISRTCVIAGVVLCGFLGVGVAGSGNARLGLPLASVLSRPGQIELGRKLFMDTALSANGRMACATCHVPEQGFTQNERATPAGADGRPLRRNAPTLLNVAFARPLMHDGAAPSLKVQVLTPLLHANEMANVSFSGLETRLSADPAYRNAFLTVYGQAPSMALIGDALAAYQQTLISGGSAFDRWKYGGEADALSDEARRGFELFTGKAGCSGCHLVGAKSALFTDNGMHRTGAGDASSELVAAANESVPTFDAIDFASSGERGRHEVTQRPEDLYKFRTPTLRNVAITAPYMHDGSLATLEDVLSFYNSGGGGAPDIDPRIKPLGLDDEEVAALVAFLKSLTGSNVAALANDARSAAQ